MIIEFRWPVPCGSIRPTSELRRAHHVTMIYIGQFVVWDKYQNTSGLTAGMFWYFYPEYMYPVIRTFRIRSAPATSALDCENRTRFGCSLEMRARSATAIDGGRVVASNFARTKNRMRPAPPHNLEILYDRGVATRLPSINSQARRVNVCSASCGKRELGR